MRISTHKNGTRLIRANMQWSNPWMGVVAASISFMPAIPSSRRDTCAVRKEMRMNKFPCRSSKSLLLVILSSPSPLSTSQNNSVFCNENNQNYYLKESGLRVAAAHALNSVSFGSCKMNLLSFAIHTAVSWIAF